MKKKKDHYIEIDMARKSWEGKKNEKRSLLKRKNINGWMNTRKTISQKNLWQIKTLRLQDKTKKKESQGCSKRALGVEKSMVCYFLSITGSIVSSRYSYDQRLINILCDSNDVDIYNRHSS